MNLNLVIDTSNFKPFDISPAMLILHDYRDTYYKYEDLMNKIAEELGEYVLPETSGYKGTMDKYNEDFNTASANFNRRMDLHTLNTIRNLRKRYATEIVPIRKMVENYNKDIDKVQEIRRSNPSAIILMKDLDSYYGGTTGNYNYISGNLVVSEVSTGTKAILNEARHKYLFKSVAAVGYLEQVNSGRMSVNDLQKLAYNPNTPIDVANDLKPIVNTLSNFYNDVRSRYSFDNMNKESKDALDYHIGLGAVSAAIPTLQSIIEDRSYATPRTSTKEPVSAEDTYKAITTQLIANGYKYDKDKKAWIRKASELKTTTLDDYGQEKTVTKYIPEDIIPDDDIVTSIVRGSGLPLLSSGASGTDNQNVEPPTPQGNGSSNGNTTNTNATDSTTVITLPIPPVARDSTGTGGSGGYTRPKRGRK